ncbi:MAG: RHS repeat-associated core domain-containing protein [Pseudobdellovibrio sp.]
MQELEYDEFGNMMKNTNPDFQPVTYTGGLYDKDTKFLRLGARDYDSTVGRWTTKDPIGFNGGDTNLYAYVGGNPMSYVDPTGLWSLGASGYLGLGGGISFGQNPDNQWFLDIQIGVGLGIGGSFNKHGTSPDWGNKNGVNGGPALAVGGFFDAGVNFGPLNAGYSGGKGMTVLGGPNVPTQPYSSSGFYGGITSSFGAGAGASAGAEFCVRP